MANRAEFTAIERSCWDVLGALAVLCVPSLVWLGGPFWQLPIDLAMQMVCLAFAHVVANLGTRAVSGSRTRRVFLSTLVVLLAYGATCLVFLAQPALQFSRLTAAISFILSVSLILGPVFLGRAGRTLALGLLLAGSAYSALLAGIDVRNLFSTPDQQPIGEYILSARYTLRKETYGIGDPDELRPGGGITELGVDRVALTGTGALYLLTQPDEDSPVVSRRIGLPSPLNWASFSNDVPANVNRGTFRAHDVIARQVVGGWELFVSHHSWDSQHRCVRLAVSKATVDERVVPVSTSEDWSVVFRAEPCLPIDGTVRGIPFAGLEAGGRLAWLDDGGLLMTTGDHQFDGVNRPAAVAQDDSYDYGKTLVIDVETGAHRQFTKGHRNPQGLLIDEDGRIWSTEHGPQGGDELNLLVAGGNYGWPNTSFGTDYGRHDWPIIKSEGVTEYLPPVFAWVPSIGISNLIRVTDRRFPDWRGDLLVASLRARSLFRVALNGSQVSYVEPIPVDLRIRDLIEGPWGNIWLWIDDGNLITLSPDEQVTRGSAVFAQCAGCHMIDPHSPSGGLGPNLYGILGAPPASKRPYNYSKALLELRGVWTAEQLDAFLADPTTFVPGTTMTYSVSSPDERAAVISFLRTLTSN